MPQRLQTTAEKHPPKKASLLGLPDELQTEIYKLALIEQQPLPVLSTSNGGAANFADPGLLSVSLEERALSLPVPSASNEGAAGFTEPGLLFVSRKTRTLSLPIYYGSNVFKAYNSAQAATFVRIFPEHKLQLITAIRAFTPYFQDTGVEWSDRPGRRTVQHWCEEFGDDLVQSGKMLLPVLTRKDHTRLRGQYWSTDEVAYFKWVSVTRLPECEVQRLGRADVLVLKEKASAADKHVTVR